MPLPSRTCILRLNRSTPTCSWRRRCVGPQMTSLGSAEHDGQSVFLRLNSAFPDEPLYSLLIDDGVTVELDDLPACWDRGPLWANRR